VEALNLSDWYKIFQICFVDRLASLVSKIQKYP
jgi:hypothetical protein